MYCIIYVSKANPSINSRFVGRTASLMKAKVGVYVFIRNTRREYPCDINTVQDNHIMAKGEIIAKGEVVARTNQMPSVNVWIGEIYFVGPEKGWR
jgi:hypothetical protein